MAARFFQQLFNKERLEWVGSKRRRGKSHYGGHPTKKRERERERINGRVIRVHFVTKWTIASCRVAWWRRGRRRRKRSNTLFLSLVIIHWWMAGQVVGSQSDVWGGQDRKASREKETVLLDKNLISSLNVFNIGPTRPCAVWTRCCIWLFLFPPPVSRSSPPLSPFRFFSCLLLCVFFFCCCCCWENESLPLLHPCVYRLACRVCLCVWGLISAGLGSLIAERCRHTAEQSPSLFLLLPFFLIFSCPHRPSSASLMDGWNAHAHVRSVEDSAQFSKAKYLPLLSLTWPCRLPFSFIPT